MGFEKSRQAFAELTRSLDESAERFEHATANIERCSTGATPPIACLEEIMCGGELKPETIKMFLGE